MARLEFPAGFHFGVASAAQASEGAAREAGRGDSIWDGFAARPGAICDGSTPARASDAYHRELADIALLRNLGATSARFSLSWPRIFPRGRGAPNGTALDHYSRRVDALLDAGIRPLVALYHWDLPEWIERSGGWPERDTAGRFADYALVAARALGDRVRDWLLVADPLTFALRGYGTGRHAPGRCDPVAFWRATHVINLAQAEGSRALRAAEPDARVGSELGLWACEPARDTDADLAAAQRWDRLCCDWFTAPLRGDGYPELALEGESLEARLDYRTGDDERLRAPLDYLGVALRQRLRIQHSPGHPLGVAAQPRPAFEGAGETLEAGDPARAAALAARLIALYERSGRVPLEITESAVPRADEKLQNGELDDAPRIDAHAALLAALGRALEAGVDLRGYHVWSLLDGFEWQHGTSRRCGLVHVDFATSARTPKRSARWFAEVASERGLAI
jgi:beta-glucosidase